MTEIVMFCFILFDNNFIFEILVDLRVISMKYNLKLTTADIFFSFYLIEYFYMNIF